MNYLILLMMSFEILSLYYICSDALAKRMLFTCIDTGHLKKLGKGFIYLKSDSQQRWDGQVLTFMEYRCKNGH